MLIYCSKWQEVRDREEVAAKIAALENPESYNLMDGKSKEKMINELKSTPPTPATFYLEDTMLEYRAAVNY